MILATVATVTTVTVTTYCVLSQWLASTLCYWHCSVETEMSHGRLLKATLKTDPDLWLCWAWATVWVVLSLCWATVWVALSWRPFTELRNIDIDPLSSFIGDYPGSLKSFSTVGVENLLLINRRILIKFFIQHALTYFLTVFPIYPIGLVLTQIF